MQFFTGSFHKLNCILLLDAASKPDMTVNLCTDRFRTRFRLRTHHTHTHHMHMPHTCMHIHISHICHPPPSTHTHTQAGGIAGTTVDIVLFPLDTIKTRLQSSKGFWGAGGFHRIYAGIVPAAAGSAPTGRLHPHILATQITLPIPTLIPF